MADLTKQAPKSELEVLLELKKATEEYAAVLAKHKRLEAQKQKLEEAKKAELEKKDPRAFMTAAEKRRDTIWKKQMAEFAKLREERLADAEKLRKSLIVKERNRTRQTA